MELNINPEEVLKPRMKPKRRRIKLGDIFEIPYRTEQMPTDGYTRILHWQFTIYGARM